MIPVRVLQRRNGYRAESDVTPIIVTAPTWEEALALLIREVPERFGIKLTVEARSVDELRRPPADDATPGQKHFARALLSNDPRWPLVAEAVTAID